MKYGTVPGYGSWPGGGTPGGLATWLILQIVFSPEEKIIHSNLERHKPTENKPILLNGTRGYFFYVKPTSPCTLSCKDWTEESYCVKINLNPLTAEWALRALIDFTLSNPRRFYSSMGNPLAGKGLTASKNYVPINPLTAEWALRAPIDFTLSKARRFYWSMGNPLAGKGLTETWTLIVSITFYPLTMNGPFGGQ